MKKIISLFLMITIVCFTTVTGFAKVLSIDETLSLFGTSDNNLLSKSEGNDLVITIPVVNCPDSVNSFDFSKWQKFFSVWKTKKYQWISLYKSVSNGKSTHCIYFYYLDNEDINNLYNNSNYLGGSSSNKLYSTCITFCSSGKSTFSFYQDIGGSFSCFYKEYQNSNGVEMYNSIIGSLSFNPISEKYNIPVLEHDYNVILKTDEKDEVPSSPSKPDIPTPVPPPDFSNPFNSEYVFLKDSDLDIIVSWFYKNLNIAMPAIFIPIVIIGLFSFLAWLLFKGNK